MKSQVKVRMKPGCGNQFIGVTDHAMNNTAILALKSDSNIIRWLPWSSIAHVIVIEENV